MHPEADAFLDAIFDNPDDDTPRLVYADWLTEHGQESYAQFIRLQCAAARHPLWSDEANRLWEEIGRVWNRLEEEWWPGTSDVWQLPGVRSVYDYHSQTFVNRPGPCPRLLDAIHFHRGLLKPGISLSCAQAIRYSAFWSSIMTSNATLTLDGPHTAVAEIAVHPLLRNVRQVICADDGYDYDDYSQYADAVNNFLSSPHLRRARTLDLTGIFLDGDGIERLLFADHLPNVVEVRLREFYYPDTRAETLSQLQKKFASVVCV